MQQIDRVVEVVEEALKGIPVSSLSILKYSWALRNSCGVEPGNESMRYYRPLRLCTGHTVRLFKQKRENGHKLGGAPLDLPKIRKNPLVEIIPINTG